MVEADTQSLIEKLHSETAQIAWRELQRFFAQGAVLQVSSELDLVATAVLIAEDDRHAMEALVKNKQVIAPGNDQARAWYESDSVLWTVVVAPYVLVQDANAN